MRSIAASSSGDMGGRRQCPDADGRFNKAPYFNFNDGQVKFDTNDVDNAYGNYGSASGFLAKSLLRKKQHHTCSVVLLYRVERIQPPNMRPISSIISCSTT